MKNTITAMLLMCLSSTAYAENLQKDFAAFLDMLPGRYSNDAQHQSELASKPAEPHGQLASEFSMVNNGNILSLLGPYVVEQRLHENGDMSKVYRHVLMTFTIDEAKSAIVQTAWQIRPAGKDLTTITQADLTALPDGCDTLWNRTDDGFEGIMAKGTCKFPSRIHPGEFRLIEAKHYPHIRQFQLSGMGLQNRWHAGVRPQRPRAVQNGPLTQLIGRHMTRILFTILAFIIAIPASAQVMGSKNPIYRDMRLMMDWFEGRFDNQEQVYFNKELGVPEDERHERIHSIFHRVDLKGLWRQCLLCAAIPGWR